MDRAAAMLGFDREAVKYTGRGVCIGVADTGIAPHPDFFDASGFRVREYKDFIENKRYVSDYGGHGTHVCGIACGNGSASNGLYRGIATEADLAVAKVLDRTGRGKISNMINALKWFLEIRNKVNLRVVNMSFSVNDLRNRSYLELANVIRRMWYEGITVVCAAGNKGPAFGSVTAPGTIREVITVGAADDDVYVKAGGGYIKNYSGRGYYEKFITKPEVCAPASNIVSCEQKYLESSEYFINSANRNKLYSAESGTSMAAPMIAGIVAILVERNSILMPDEIKRMIMASCVSINKPAYIQGAGMPNIRKLFGV